MRRAAGFIIFRKINIEIEYLLLQTSYGIHHWTPPKGHLEPEETDLKAAFRETEEEAGFGKEDLRVIEGFQKILNYPVNGAPKTVIYFLAELLKNKPVTLSLEHQDYKWASVATACQLVQYNDLQKVLQECEEYLSNNYKG